jgi:hypothetical protein
MKKIILASACILLASCVGLSDQKMLKTFPVYGNYCGSNNPKAGTSPMPIDMTDFSCKEHGACYEERGGVSKVCDRKLIKSLKRVQSQNNLEKSIQESITLYFKKSLKLK